MPGLEDMIRSSVPGGNIGKPLMIALAAFSVQALCSAAAVQDSLPARARNRHRTTAAPVVDCLVDWAAC